MTIEEAIERYTSNAEYERTHGNLQGCLEFRQLAEWLKYYKQLKEQEHCEDVISRQAMHIELEKWITYGEYKYSNATKYLYDRIDRLPSVTPQPEVGRWIYDKNIDNWKCSECGETPKTMGYCGSADFMAKHFKYCNHCGCKMQEVEDD